MAACALRTAGAGVVVRRALAVRMIDATTGPLAARRAGRQFLHQYRDWQCADVHGLPRVPKRPAWPLARAVERDCRMFRTLARIIRTFGFPVAAVAASRCQVTAPLLPAYRAWPHPPGNKHGVDRKMPVRLLSGRSRVGVEHAFGVSGRGQPAPTPCTVICWNGMPQPYSLQASTSSVGTARRISGSSGAAAPSRSSSIS